MAIGEKLEVNSISRNYYQIESKVDLSFTYPNKAFIVLEHNDNNRDQGEYKFETYFEKGNIQYEEEMTIEVVKPLDSKTLKMNELKE